MKFLISLLLFFVSTAWAVDCRTLLEPSFQMRHMYVGEKRVHYIWNENEREARRLTYSNEQIFVGGLPDHCQRWLGCSKIFVIDQNGQMYVADYSDIQFKHSSFFAGLRVKAAGRLTIKNNRIVYFDNFSGHYLPDERSNAVTLNSLLLAGMPLPNKIGFAHITTGWFGGNGVNTINLSKPIRLQSGKIKETVKVADVFFAIEEIINANGVRSQLQELLSEPTTLSTIAKLDLVYRTGWIRRGIPNTIGESVWAHSRKLARAASQYPTERRGLNRERMVNMSYFHDFAEYEVPDYTPSDKISTDEKHALERQAITKIAQSSGRYGQMILELWEEYNAKQTAEAKLVSQLDKLDAAVQALEYQKMGYDTADFIPYTKTKLTDPLLIEIFEKLVNSKTPQRNYYDQYFELLSRAQ